VSGPLFEYPGSAKVGRVVPKTTIYTRARVSAKLKARFVEQVGQITWAFKLAPETVNIKPSPPVQEIQIFHVQLKQGELHNDVLHCIDQAIPFPTVFELLDADRTRVVAAFKRPSENDTARWTHGDYFPTAWLKSDTPRKALPIVRDLSQLYDALLVPLLPHPRRDAESLADASDRMRRIGVAERELVAMQRRIANEKQFNRKVEMNREARALRASIAGMTSTPAEITDAQKADIA
jgi:hypothetical protein